MDLYYASFLDEKESKEIEFNKEKNRVQLYVCVIGDLLARNLSQQVLFVIINIHVYAIFT